MTCDVTVTQEDIDIAEKANVIWGNACGGPDVAAIAAALSRIKHSTPAAPASQVEELISAIEDAGHGYSIKLVRLVDDIATYELKYQGQITEHESHEDALEALSELARQEKVSAATAFLARHRLATLADAQGEPVGMALRTLEEAGVTVARFDKANVPAGTMLYTQPPAQDVAALVEQVANALDGVIAAFPSYRTRNGKSVSIEASDGEKCWIIHDDVRNDAINARAALASFRSKP